MKVFVVALSAILFVACTVAHPHGPGPNHSGEDCGKPPIKPELQEYLNDLRDFVALYPIEDIKSIVGSHLQDEELQDTIAFLRSDEFEEIAEQIANSPEVQAVDEYLKNADWPWARTVIRAALAQRRALRGGRSSSASDSSSSGDVAVATGGLDGLIDDIISVLPKDELRALFFEKLQSSEVFRKVVQILTSDELRQLVANVAASESLRPLFQRIEENGVHAEKIKELVLALFGF